MTNGFVMTNILGIIAAGGQQKEGKSEKRTLVTCSRLLETFWLPPKNSDCWRLCGFLWNTFVLHCRNKYDLLTTVGTYSHSFFFVDTFCVFAIHVSTNLVTALAALPCLHSLQVIVSGPFGGTWASSAEFPDVWPGSVGVWCMRQLSGRSPAGGLRGVRAWGLD